MADWSTQPDFSDFGEMGFPESRKGMARGEVRDQWDNVFRDRGWRGTDDNSFQTWDPEYYQRAPSQSSARRAYFAARQPPPGSADADIFQFESAWEPRYGGNTVGGGAGFTQLQDYDRHGWGNVQWLDPFAKSKELQGVEDRIEELRDKMLEDPDLDPEDDGFFAAQGEHQREQADLQWQRGDAVRERERLEEAHRGRYADASYLTEFQKPWYETWYMPRDFSKKVGV
jgi:hypothetical protein